jgi:two-component system NtrC family sensor kinase
MEKIRAKLAVSFSAKVLFPVVGVMMLLLAMTVWLVNQRITEQSHAEAARTLATADAVFQSSQKIRNQNLLLRYRHVVTEPLYKARFQQLDRPTLDALLTDLLGEHAVDVILFTTAEANLFSHAQRDPLLSTSEFEARSAPAVTQALAGNAKADTIRVGDRLFDVVSIPVSGTGDNLIGALTFASEIRDTDAQEFSQVTHSQIVLLANNHVIASTLSGQEPQPQLARLFSDYAGDAADPGASTRIKKTVLAGDNYYYLAGTFASLSGDGKLGYLLLSSYESALHALHHTQQTLVLASVLGILLGTLVIWLLVRRVTQPLRALSQSAEAVGQGDFSQKVEVTTSDECGELASVFNQMTENLKRSREQLETTVESLKATQAQLIQSEKLSGIGEFVAGVAHELNNPLTSVMGFSELLQRADTDPQHQRYLEMIHKSALRCQKVVQNLLSFARRHKPERKLSSINELVEGAIDILQYQMRTSNIEVVPRLDPHLPQALVDPHQLQQVFLNIINNARQSIEAHQPKGCVRITSETSGENVRIAFQDNGPGIPEANLSKLFDPFFTTKEVGKGTGLGLSICYGIVKDHGGKIMVCSKPGEGATFIVELPLAHETTGQHNTNQAPTLPATIGREGAGKKVLVIDDEEPILQMVRETLAVHGYEVDIARDGETALRRLDQTAYDLTLCDWKMPGLNGQQVYERVRASNPALSDRMIFFTGDIINERAQSFLRERKKVCLSKPFSLVEFRTAVRQALAPSS